MVQNGRWAALAMSISLGAFASGNSHRGGALAGAKNILVVASDYALAAPDTISAGAITLRLENRGDKMHEVVLALVRGRADAATIMAAAQAKVPTVRLGEAYADGPPLGAVFAAPHATSHATLTARVERGRDYVLVCTLRDVPDAPQHAALGMFHVIHVR